MCPASEHLIYLFRMSFCFDTTKDLSLFKRGLPSPSPISPRARELHIRYSDHPLYLRVLHITSAFIYIFFVADSIL